MAKKSKGADAPQPVQDDRDWQAESALRTMQEAEQHQNDPDMMKRVAKHAKKQADGLDAVMTKLRARGLVSDKQAGKVAKKRAVAS